MFDIGWSELLVIGVVALIVVGPKDLPVMFRSLGRMTAKARSMAREFSRAMEDAAKDTGLDAATKGLSDLKGLAGKTPGLSALEKATEKFEKWEPKLPGTIKTPEPPKWEPDPELVADLDAAEAAPEPGPAPAPKAAKPKAPKATTPKAAAPKAAAPKAAAAKPAKAPKPAKTPKGDA